MCNRRMQGPHGFKSIPCASQAKNGPQAAWGLRQPKWQTHAEDLGIALWPSAESSLIDESRWFPVREQELVAENFHAAGAAWNIAREGNDGLLDLELAGCRRRGIRRAIGQRRNAARFPVRYTEVVWKRLPKSQLCLARSTIERMNWLSASCL